VNRSTRSAIDIMVTRVPELQREGATRETYATAVVAGHEADGILGEDEIHAVAVHGLSYFDGSSAFITDGAPVISVTLEQARTLAELDPPEAYEREWQFSTSTMLIDIGDVGCVFAQKDYGPIAIMGDGDSGTAMLAGLMGCIPTGGGCSIGSTKDDRIASRLLGNLAYLIAHPEALPKHWKLERRHPSPVAERKRARQERRMPRVLPGTLWILGAERLLSECVDRDQVGDGTNEKNWKWGVRTWRSAHYRWQACGPQWSKRRLVLIHGHDMGDPNAPLSVHVLRVG